MKAEEKKLWLREDWAEAGVIKVELDEWVPKDGGGGGGGGGESQKMNMTWEKGGVGIMKGGRERKTRKETEGEEMKTENREARLGMWKAVFVWRMHEES